MKNIIPFLIILLIVGCNSNNEVTADSLEDKINRLKTEIDIIINASTGNNSNDCRTSYIAGGNGCGPIYVYGVIGIDTIQLERLFNELSEAQTNLYSLKGGPVCSIMFPDKDSLING